MVQDTSGKSLTETVSHFGEADQAIMKRLQANDYKPQVIFDVGASNGCWTWQMKGVLPEAEFYLFEPLIDHIEGYDRVMRNILEALQNVKLFKYALGEYSGQTEITVFPGELGAVSSTTLPYDDAPKGARKFPVQVYTLDEAISTFDLPIPQVLKIDVQGSELAILKGAKKTLPEIDILLLECWMLRGYRRRTPLLLELWQWLEDRGFYLWDLGDCYRNDQDVLTTQDCVFVNRRTSLVPEQSYKSDYVAPKPSRWKRFTRRCLS